MNKENSVKKQFTRSEVYAALELAFEAGHYGSLELRDDSLQEILNNFFDFAPSVANEKIKMNHLFTAQQNFITSSPQLDYGNFEFSAYNQSYVDQSNSYMPLIITE